VEGVEDVEASAKLIFVGFLCTNAENQAPKVHLVQPSFSPSHIFWKKLKTFILEIIFRQ
jgi:hypothetical protein